MAEKEKSRDIRALVAQFRTSDHWAVSLARDLLWVAGVVGTIALILYLLCGTWPAVVTIESGSMTPNMNIGDLVVVVQKDRYGEFMTWEDAKEANVTKFNGYGDVVIYKPNGMTSVHPIIHRAMVYATTDTPITEIRGVQLLYELYGAPRRVYHVGRQQPGPRPVRQLRGYRYARTGQR